MILAIDTATRWLGLALHDGQAVVAEMGWRTVNRHTVELAPAVAEMWQRAGISAADLKGIGVAIGPGSYSGLRVGLGLAKGLSLAYQVPLVGVSTLDILAAAAAPFEGVLVAVAEAGRRRVNAAFYGWHGKQGWRVQTPAETFEWPALLQQVAGPALFTGEISPAAARQIRQWDKTCQVMPAAPRVRRAGYLAELAWRRVRRGRADDAAALSPLYLRGPAGK